MLKNKPKKLNKDLENLKKQVKENLEGWKKARADLINYKKRQEKEREEFAKFAKVDLLLSLLKITDNFDSAFKNVPEKLKQDSWILGIEQIKNQFKDGGWNCILKENHSSVNNNLSVLE